MANFESNGSNHEQFFLNVFGDVFEFLQFSRIKVSSLSRVTYYENIFDKKTETNCQNTIRQLSEGSAF